MSFREKMRLNLPFYFVLSVIFSVAVWSLWLPNWFSKVQDVDAAPVTNFSTAIDAVSRVPSGSQVKIVYNAGTYAMVFTSNTVAASGTTSTCAYLTTGDSQQCSLYFTKSTDGGVTWGTPVLVSSGVYYSSNREELGSFLYDSRRNVWVVTYKIDDNNGNYHIVQSYSSTGASWTTATVLSDNDAMSLGYVGRSSVIAFATSSNLRAIFGQRGDVLEVGTTTNTGLTSSWPTSTVMNVSNYKDNDAGNWEYARPLGLSIDYDDNIHAVFALATTTAAGGYEIVYASSTDLGLTWSTSSISGRLSSPAMEDVIGLELGMNSAEVDPYTGRLTVFYHHMTSFDGDLLMSGIISGTTTLRIAQLGANGLWTTSTINSAVPFRFDVPEYDSNFNLVTLHPNSVTVPYTGMYAGAFFGTSSYPYIAINTSTLVMEQVDSTTISNMSEMGTAYNSTTKELAVAFVDSSTFKVKFTTTSLAIAEVNEYATTTQIYPSFVTSGTGLVTVTTTVRDVNRETATVYMDYSTDGGTTWSSSTLYTATGEGGSLTTSTGKVTGVATTDGSLSSVSQDITMYWNTQVDLAASSTTNVLLRIKASDGISDSPNYNISSVFTVDNVAPSAPTSLLLTPSTSSIAFSWGSVSGAEIYSVSSTAMSASTTVLTVVTSTSLTPNSLYIYQAQAYDSYSNTSSLSSVTSTYTDPVVVTGVTASATGQTTMTVSWTSTNGSGTVYELYNETTGATVGTTQSTSYSVTGLTAGTSYQFKVRVQYLIDTTRYTSYSDTSTAVSTSAASTSNDSGGGGSAPAASPPSVPATQPTTPAAATSMELSLNQPVTKTVGASTHTYTALSATAQSAMFKIQSEPITLTLSTGLPKEVDTNKDSINDLRVTYSGLVNGKPKLMVANLTDENELKNALTIRAGAYETNSRTVTLTLNSNAVQMAISNTADFAGSTFRSYSPSVSWELTPGNGLKTVYVRLRSPQGSTVTVSDTITLNASGVTLPPSIIDTKPPVTTPPAATYPALTRTLKRGMTGADVKVMQLELQKLGYFPKNVVANSVFGPTTEASVRAYQQSQKVPVSGQMTITLYNTLMSQYSTPIQNPAPSSSVTPLPSSKPNLYRGSSGANVTWVQEKLKALGYFPKNVMANGYYGPTTQSSVRAFQKANGISQTGTVGPLTWGALSK